MASNVLSWNKALAKGYNPLLYPYQSDAIPVGVITVVLEFKIWAKKVMGISCYFRQLDTGALFQVTIYHKAGIGYKIAKDGIDFATCLTEKMYQLTTAFRPTGKVFIKAAADFVDPAKT